MEERVLYLLYRYRDLGSGRGDGPQILGSQRSSGRGSACFEQGIKDVRRKVTNFVIFRHFLLQYPLRILLPASPAL